MNGPWSGFGRVYLKSPLRHGISWGCGLGAFERDARRFGIVEEIDAFDVSELPLADARREPEALRLGGIHYLVGDFHHLSIRAASTIRVFTPRFTMSPRSR